MWNRRPRRFLKRAGEGACSTYILVPKLPLGNRLSRQALLGPASGTKRPAGSARPTALGGFCAGEGACSTGIPQRSKASRPCAGVSPPLGSYRRLQSKKLILKRLGHSFLSPPHTPTPTPGQGDFSGIGKKYLTPLFPTGYKTARFLYPKAQGVCLGNP
jgi:hypothetical protein